MILKLSISRERGTIQDPDQTALRQETDLPFETRTNLHRYALQTSLTQEMSNKV